MKHIITALGFVLATSHFAARAAEIKPAAPAKAVALEIQVRVTASEVGKPVRLVGKDARQQLVITARDAAGALRDVTHEVTFTSAPANLVRIAANGLITPAADGATTITAQTKDGLKATLAVAVEKATIGLPINFANQIVPIFTKSGCNSGGCHGKSGGQNGFKLSLLGFEPTEDYEYLVKEGRGRRVLPAAPERSLLLLKASAMVPHGGGKRIDADSFDYQLISRWIAQGMSYGNPTDPTVARIEVFPKQRTLALGGNQQLAVTAYYTDGTAEDVTHTAVYEANDKEMGKAENTGHVSVFQQPGDVGVMIRYQGKVSVFRATVPLGAPVEKLPPARNFIDEIVFNKLKAVGMPASEVCDDATFIRRVTLDLGGRLPTLEESRAFLADAGPSKRDLLIDRLLEGTDYADYFANKWASLLRNKRGQPTHQRGNYAFHAWIRDALVANKPYDQFAREVLAASGDIASNPPVAWYRQVTTANMQLEDTAQLFLGTRLQCAQCHHHPYEKWSQNDYYSFSAFFSQVARKPGSQAGEEVIYHRRGNASAVNKKNSQTVKPAGLGAPPVELAPDEDPRHALADWLSAKDNPFFAHTLANRYWKHFFNRGLVEPEDDMRETNPPVNPELLDALARYFVASKYDMKQFVRTLCQSKTYQLSSVPNKYNAADKHNFSRYYPKRLSAEVLFDAVNGLTKSGGGFAGLPADTRAVQLPDNSFNATSYFLTVFGRPDSSSACECERSMDASLAQSLHLLNSRDIQDKLASNTGRAALLVADSRSDDEKIRELYLLAFARQPDTGELSLAREHLLKQPKDKEGKVVQADARKAYEDVIWALFNTKEFLFNH
ncbi:MAG: DUF1553 domain-containing protein [Pedosphaera sp.]|nr:DUF1553 domain-containing protein [Pedosphaera sp.]